MISSEEFVLVGVWWVSNPVDKTCLLNRAGITETSDDKIQIKR
jgi:hypothetical protein